MGHAKYWIALERVEGIGPASLQALYEALRAAGVSIADLFSLSADEIRHEFSLPEKIVSAFAPARAMMDRVEHDYLRLIDGGFDTILFFDPAYPARLKAILASQAPPVLYVYGRRDLLKKKCAAVLGDRNVSEKGALISHLASKILSEHDIPVASGLARGADIAAHRSALEYGGSTIIVPPYGAFNSVIPESLGGVIDFERALIVSPFYPATEYSPFNSLARNRVIVALSCAVFIVESPREGGIFEAGKSAHQGKVPLFVTEYAEYPESASGNRRLVEEFGAVPVRGRMEQDLLVPNLDRLIAAVKFGQ